jgi:hypothetical protein
MANQSKAEQRVRSKAGNFGPRKDQKKAEKQMNAYLKKKR